MNMDTFRNHSSKRKWLVDTDGDPRGEMWIASKTLRKKKSRGPSDCLNGTGERERDWCQG